MTINTYGRTEIARVRALVEDVARAIIPEPERASHVHAMAVGEPIAMPGRRETPQESSLLCRYGYLSSIRILPNLTQKARQNPSPGDTGDLRSQWFRVVQRGTTRSHTLPSSLGRRTPSRVTQP